MLTNQMHKQSRSGKKFRGSHYCEAKASGAFSLKNVNRNWRAREMKYKIFAFFSFN
jgi:hypothetical protein